MKKLFICDWDDSLRKGFSALAWVNYLFLSDLYDKDSYYKLNELVKAYRNNKISYESFVKGYALNYGQGVKNISIKSIQVAAERFALSERSKVSSFTFQFLYDLLERNFDLIILSGSPSIFLKFFFEPYKPIAVLGLEIEYNKTTGLYNGIVKDQNGSSNFKIEVFNFYKNKYDIIGAIGDSPSDIEVIKNSDIGIFVGSKDVGGIKEKHIIKVDHSTIASTLTKFVDARLSKLSFS